MSAKELEQAQERLHQRIDEIAEMSHLLDSGKETIKRAAFLILKDYD